MRGISDEVLKRAWRARWPQTLHFRPVTQRAPCAITIARHVSLLLVGSSNCHFYSKTVWLGGRDPNASSTLPFILDRAQALRSFVTVERAYSTIPVEWWSAIAIFCHLCRRSWTELSACQISSSPPGLTSAPKHTTYARQVADLNYPGPNDKNSMSLKHLLSPDIWQWRGTVCRGAKDKHQPEF